MLTVSLAFSFPFAEFCAFLEWSWSSMFLAECLNSLFYELFSRFTDWTECLCLPSPPTPTLSFLCWNPNPQCDGIRRWALGRWLGHEGGALMNGISACMRRQRAPSLLLPCGDSARWLSMNQEASPHQTPNLLAPELREIHVLFRRQPVAGVFVLAAQTD